MTLLLWIFLLSLQYTHVFSSQDCFLEEKANNAGRVDAVNDCPVQTLELEL